MATSSTATFAIAASNRSRTQLFRSHAIGFGLLALGGTTRVQAVRVILDPEAAEPELQRATTEEPSPKPPSKKNTRFLAPLGDEGPGGFPATGAVGSGEAAASSEGEVHSSDGEEEWDSTATSSTALVEVDHGGNSEGNGGVVFPGLGFELPTHASKQFLEWYKKQLDAKGLVLEGEETDNIVPSDPQTDVPSDPQTEMGQTTAERFPETIKVLDVKNPQPRVVWSWKRLEKPGSGGHEAQVYQLEKKGQSEAATDLQTLDFSGEPLRLRAGQKAVFKPIDVIGKEDEKPKEKEKREKNVADAMSELVAGSIFRAVTKQIYHGPKPTPPGALPYCDDYVNCRSIGGTTIVVKTDAGALFTASIFFGDYAADMSSGDGQSMTLSWHELDKGGMREFLNFDWGNQPWSDAVLEKGLMSPGTPAVGHTGVVQLLSKIGSGRITFGSAWWARKNFQSFEASHQQIHQLGLDLFLTVLLSDPDGHFGNIGFFKSESGEMYMRRFDVGWAFASLEPQNQVFFPEAEATALTATPDPEKGFDGFLAAKGWVDHAPNLGPKGGFLRLLGKMRKPEKQPVLLHYADFFETWPEIERKALDGVESESSAAETPQTAEQVHNKVAELIAKPVLTALKCDVFNEASGNKMWENLVRIFGKANLKAWNQLRMQFDLGQVQTATEDTENAIDEQLFTQLSDALKQRVTFSYNGVQAEECHRADESVSAGTGEMPVPAATAGVDTGLSPKLAGTGETPDE
ncbi:unnamed protein product [Amoebophrya sp. A120]|nr:unnamed protein product [Amoebophrya sp. A120]|eukprot:GSA120T00020454001.1